MCVPLQTGGTDRTTDLPFSSFCETILQLILGRRQWFIDALGYIALGLESTLPLPQMVR